MNLGAKLYEQANAESAANTSNDAPKDDNIKDAEYEEK